MEILVEGAGTLTFWWKVSCDSGDELQFLLDGQEVPDIYQKVPAIDGEVDWHLMTYNVSGPGIHSFLWQYVVDSSYDPEYSGDECGFVDSVEWSGSQSSYYSISLTPTASRTQTDS